MEKLVKEHVLAILTDHREDLKRFGVKRCGLFGSFERGDQTKQSDIDILVEFEPGKKSFDNFVYLAFFLKALLGRRVDLITVESLSPYIGPHILREVVYAPLGA